MDDLERKSWLVLRAQSGDREALDALLLELQWPLFRYLRSLTGNEDTAKDLLQEVLLLLCHKLVWLRDPDLLLPWIFRIASREAFRYLRNERARAVREREPSDLDALSSPAPTDYEAQELIARLPGLLDQVSPASRAVLVLHYFQEMSLQEVGEVLGIGLGTVKSRLGYGLRVLARRVDDEGLRTGLP